MGSMTLKRLLITVAALVVLSGGGIAGLWQYAYTPTGRARTVFCEVRNDGKGPRAWLLAHGVIRPEIKAKIEALARRSNVDELDLSSSEQYGAFAGIAAEDRLVEIGTEASSAAVAALSEEDQGVRFAAMHICVKFRETRAVGPLAEILSDGRRESGERMECAWALGQLHCDQAIPALAAALEDKTEGNRGGVRIAAAIALAKFKDKRAVPVLREALGNDALREKAAGTLVELGEEDGLLILSAELRDRTGNIGNVATVLGDSDDRRAVGPLLDLMGDPTVDKYCHVQAATALGKLGDKRAISALRKMLADPDEDIRNAAIEAMKKLGVKDDFVPHTRPSAQSGPTADR